MVEDTANSFTNSLQVSEKIDFFVKKIIFIFKFLRLQEIKISCRWIFSEALEQHESGEISAETIHPRKKFGCEHTMTYYKLSFQ